MIHKRRSPLDCRVFLIHWAASDRRSMLFHMNPDEITRLIEDGLPGADVHVRSDDNTHFEAIVVADAFAGKRAIARHQLVYACLGSLIGNEIHALSIRAHTPDEWRQLTAGAGG